MSPTLYHYLHLHSCIMLCCFLASRTKLLKLVFLVMKSVDSRDIYSNKMFAGGGGMGHNGEDVCFLVVKF